MLLIQPPLSCKPRLPLSVFHGFALFAFPMLDKPSPYLKWEALQQQCKERRPLTSYRKGIWGQLGMPLKTNKWIKPQHTDVTEKVNCCYSSKGNINRQPWWTPSNAPVWVTPQPTTGFHGTTPPGPRGKGCAWLGHHCIPNMSPQWLLKVWGG